MLVQVVDVVEPQVVVVELGWASAEVADSSVAVAVASQVRCSLGQAAFAASELVVASFASVVGLASLVASSSAGSEEHQVAVGSFQEEHSALSFLKVKEN